MPKTQQKRYRVYGTADRFADRGKLFAHGEATIAREVATEDKARELASDFVLLNPPAGDGAYIAVEEILRDGGFRVLVHKRGSLHGWNGSPCWSEGDLKLGQLIGRPPC